MTAKRLSILAGGLTLAAVLAVGLVQLAGRAHTAEVTLPRLSAAQISARLRGAPAPLAALHAQAGELLGGGSTAFDARLRALRGWPVVVNKWASWCQPCRAEFAAFAHASADVGRRVAFLGIDSGDSSRAEARAFLHATPVGYPSYYDASGQLGATVTSSPVTPVTVFYARGGRYSYTHQGPYLSLAALERDIQRYALGA